MTNYTYMIGTKTCKKGQL